MVSARKEAAKAQAKDPFLAIMIIGSLSLVGIFVYWLWRVP